MARDIYGSADIRAKAEANHEVALVFTRTRGPSALTRKVGPRNYFNNNNMAIQTKGSFLVSAA